MSAELLSHDDVSDGVVVRVLTMSHPKKKNALTRSLLSALTTALSASSLGDARCVLLVGADNCFSAGFDLTALDGERDSGVDPIGGAASAIEACALPVVAGIDGVCFGGAVELAAACAVRVAAASTTFGIPAVKLGLVYPASGLFRFRRALGRHAERVLLTGFPFTAPQALMWGLIDDVGERAGALAVARTIASAAPLAVKGTRAALAAVDADVAIAVEAARAEALASADLVEGVAAAKEKRPAKFAGR